jgi:TolB-like protein
LKPSIAVLPFQNISGDPEQEYFVDGTVEEIIAALSRIRWFVVIARNSSFTYKGKAIDVKRVGRELGVRYVLEGSVRKSVNRVRISCQLVDATTGANIWTDRFDRNLEDIFDRHSPDSRRFPEQDRVSDRLGQGEIAVARSKG